MYRNMGEGILDLNKVALGIVSIGRCIAAAICNRVRQPVREIGDCVGIG